MANALDTARLAGEGRPEAAVAMLEDVAGGGGGAPAMAELVRAQLAAGDAAAARAYLEGVLAADPDSVPGRYLLAGLEALGGDTAAAEALYRAVIAADPGPPEPHQALFALLAGQGELAAAAAALDAGIAAAEENSRLVFTRAGLREADGDIAGAVADYETLYARDSADAVVANNLASLLTAQGSDPATLARAFAIARRLHGSEVPQFQDTYGWILALRGEPAAALGYLVPAAEALPGNAQVQFHRGEAELALGNRASAQAAFGAALAAAAAGSPLPQADAVRARLAELAAPAPAPAPDG
jgi:tetratricopeptide (TPR) repeat protein